MANSWNGIDLAENRARMGASLLPDPLCVHPTDAPLSAERGELYTAFVPDLTAERRKASQACAAYNRDALDVTRREQVELLRKCVLPSPPSPSFLSPLRRRRRPDQLTRLVPSQVRPEPARAAAQEGRRATRRRAAGRLPLGRAADEARLPRAHLVRPVLGLSSPNLWELDLTRLTLTLSTLLAGSARMCVSPFCEPARLGFSSFSSARRPPARAVTAHSPAARVQVFLNFNFVCLNTCDVKIGSRVLCGSNVSLCVLFPRLLSAQPRSWHCCVVQTSQSTSLTLSFVYICPLRARSQLVRHAPDRSGHPSRHRRTRDGRAHRDRRRLLARCVGRRSPRRQDWPRDDGRRRERRDQGASAGSSTRCRSPSACRASSSARSFVSY